MSSTTLLPVTTSCTAVRRDRPPSARAASTRAMMMPGTSSTATSAGKKPSCSVPADRVNVSAAVNVTAETEP